jgi:hypothetical protein
MRRLVSFKKAAVFEKKEALFEKIEALFFKKAALFGTGGSQSCKIVRKNHEKHGS